MGTTDTSTLLVNELVRRAELTAKALAATALQAGLAQAEAARAQIDRAWRGGAESVRRFRAMHSLLRFGQPPSGEPRKLR